MENYTKIFRLITALSNLTDVKLNLFYNGCVDNSKKDKLLSFISKMSLPINKREKHVKDLITNANELLLGLNKIEVIYNNFTLFIDFNRSCLWDIGKIEYRYHSLSMDTYPDLNKDFYMKKPLELSLRVIESNLEDSIKLAKLLNIDNLRHMEDDILMKIKRYNLKI